VYGFVQIGRFASLWQFSIGPPLKTKRRKLFECHDIANQGTKCKALATLLHWATVQQKIKIADANVFK
jgi:hypothetical protein